MKNEESSSGDSSPSPKSGQKPREYRARSSKRRTNLTACQDGDHQAFLTAAAMILAVGLDILLIWQAHMVLEGLR